MMIYLGYASASFLESPPLLQGALWHVPEWRREKALRYRDMRALRRSLAAALLLEWIFLNCFQGEKREFSFQNGPDGRPLLTGRPRLFCSISHGETYVCAAVGTVPVGVDIEQRNACSMEIAKEFFSPEELEQMAKDMTSIIAIMDTVKEIDITYDAVADNKNVYLNDLREDFSVPSFPTEKILQNAVNDENCFVVPKVVE